MPKRSRSSFRLLPEFKRFEIGMDARRACCRDYTHTLLHYQRIYPCKDLRSGITVMLRMRSKSWNFTPAGALNSHNIRVLPPCEAGEKRRTRQCATNKGGSVTTRAAVQRLFWLTSTDKPPVPLPRAVAAPG